LLINIHLRLSSPSPPSTEFHLSAVNPPPSAKVVLLMPSSSRVVETKLEPQAASWLEPLSHHSSTQLKDLLHPSWHQPSTECHPGAVNAGAGTKVVPTARELSANRTEHRPRTKLDPKAFCAGPQPNRWLSWFCTGTRPNPKWLPKNYRVKTDLKF